MTPWTLGRGQPAGDTKRWSPKAPVNTLAYIEKFLEENPKAREIKKKTRSTSTINRFSFENLRPDHPIKIPGHRSLGSSPSRRNHFVRYSVPWTVLKIEFQGSLLRDDHNTQWLYYTGIHTRRIVLPVTVI